MQTDSRFPWRLALLLAIPLVALVSWLVIGGVTRSFGADPGAGTSEKSASPAVTGAAEFATGLPADGIVGSECTHSSVRRESRAPVPEPGAPALPAAGVDPGTASSGKKGALSEP